MENGMDKTFTDSGASRNETTGRTPWMRRFLRGVHFVLRAVRFATLFFVLSTVAVVIVYRFVPPPLTPLMALRLVDQVRAGEPLTLKKDWTPLNRMSPWMPAAVITSEDQRFFEHHGFDFKAIEKARRHNERVRERALNGGRGGRLRGASTISQQTAKNVFLWPARSWTRKGLEVWFTFLIETLWSKERILEVYLNVAEMGDGIYGSQAAARHWFDRDASTLTRSQAALLAAILPRPRTWSPRNPPRRVTNRQQWILRQLAGGSTSPSGAPGSSLPYSDTVPDYPTTEDSWEIEPEEIPESAVPSPTDPAPGSDAINEEPLPAPQEPREPAY